MSVTDFVWGQSHWGTSDAAWSTPGPLELTAAINGFTSAVQAGGSESGGSGDVTGVVSLIGAIGTTYFAVQAGQTYSVVADTGVAVSATTARIYNRLPAAYRDDDANTFTFPVEEGGGSWDSGATWDSGETYDDAAHDVVTLQAQAGYYPLLRYLSFLWDQVGAVEATVDAFASPTSSSLADPDLADPAWLPWLSQFVGLQVIPPVTSAAATPLREQIKNAATAAPRGSTGSLATAISNVYFGGSVTPTITGGYNGSRWNLAVTTTTWPSGVTQLSLTSDSRLRAYKPVGFNLYPVTA